jgi:DNA-binding SARP family transcriptional activator
MNLAEALTARQSQGPVDRHLAAQFDLHFANRDLWEQAMQDALSKAGRYRKEANRYAELAKGASPAFLGEIYRKVAVRYVFMAEELVKGPERDGDAIERADRMISRLRPG